MDDFTLFRRLWVMGNLGFRCSEIQKEHTSNRKGINVRYRGGETYGVSEESFLHVDERSCSSVSHLHKNE